MPTILYDTFTGSAGTLLGHTPETGIAGYIWTPGYHPDGISVELDGAGSITSAEGTNAEYAGGDVVETAGITINWTFKTPVGLTLAPYAQSSGISIEIGGTVLSVSIYANAAGDAWILDGREDSVGVTLAADTTYTGTVTYIPIDRLLTSTVAGASTSAVLGVGTIDPMIGFSKLYLLPPAGYAIDSVEIVNTPPAGPTGTFYLFAPPPTLYFVSGYFFSANLRAPTSSLAAFGGASVLLTAPAARAFIGGGGGVFANAPPPTLVSTGHNSYGENAIIQSPPSPLLGSYGGANATLLAPAQTLAAEATFSGAASVIASAPDPTLSSTGIVSETGGFGVLSAPLPTLIGYSGAVLSVTNLVGVLESTGSSGGLGTMTLTCPLFSLTSTASTQAYGSADLIAPSPRMGERLQAYLVAPGATLTAIGTAVVTATYEAYALNLNHTPVPGQQQQPTDEMTRYTDFPFTHIVRYQNSYFGVAAGGLYLLEGTTDDGAEINYAVQTAKTDFGTPEKKTITYAYFGGRMGAEATITLVVGESGTETYSYTTPRGEAAQNYRQAFGRGVKSRYYAIKVEGGAALELDTLDLNVDQLTRRI